jgi:tetratricopeptide (TPR) repeat protein
MAGRAVLYDCRLHLARSDWETARLSALRYLEGFRTVGVGGDLFYAYLYLGQAEFGRGDFEEAEKWCRLALEAARLLAQEGKIPDQSNERGAVLRLLGSLALASGHFAQAGSFLKESAAIFASRQNRLEQGRTFLAQASLAAARGDFTAADASIGQARVLFKQLGAKRDLRELEKR